MLAEQHGKLPISNLAQDLVNPGGHRCEQIASADSLPVRIDLQPANGVGFKVSPAKLLAEIGTDPQYELLIETMRATGTHPVEPKELWDVFHNQPWPNRYPQIGEHMLTCGLVTRTLASCLVRNSYITESESELAFMEAVSHDLNKPAQLIYSAAIREGIIPNSFGQSDDVLIRKVLDSNSVIPQHQKIVLASGKWTDHSAVFRYLQVANDGSLELVPVNFANKLVFLSNCMVATSIPLQLGAPIENTIMLITDRLSASNQKGRYPQVWEHGLMYDPSNPQVLLHTSIHNVAPGLKLLGDYGSLITATAKGIAREWVRLVNPSSTEDPEVVVWRYLQDRLREYCD